MIWTYFISVAIYLTRLHLMGHLNTTDIQILTMCGSLRYLQVNWLGVILRDDMEHVLTLPSKEHVSVWTDNDKVHLFTEPSQNMHSVQGYISSYGSETRQHRWF